MKNSFFVLFWLVMIGLAFRYNPAGTALALILWPLAIFLVLTVIGLLLNPKH